MSTHVAQHRPNPVQPDGRVHDHNHYGMGITIGMQFSHVALTSCSNLISFQNYLVQQSNILPKLLEHLQEYPIFSSQKLIVLQLLQGYWEEKRRPSLRVSNNPLLKYRRQFYIRNAILFLNYCNHFYIFFLSRTFASGTLSYSLFFPTPFHLQIDRPIRTGKQYPRDRDYAQSYARRRRISQVPKFQEHGLGVVVRGQGLRTPVAAQAKSSTRSG